MLNDYEIRGDVAVIFLKQKNGPTLETIIDLEDLDKAKSISGRWYACFKKHTYYVISVVDHKSKKNTKTTMSLHRFLFDDVPEKMVVDHINHETLDNRRSVNLRIVTHSENVMNYMPKSKYKTRAS